MPPTDMSAVLSELGLAPCAGALAAADVDLGVLPLLSDDDLRTIGLSLGHRRKLLHAVTSGELARVQARLDAAASPAPGHASPERRRLTVLCCDLVDSTGLTQRHEPEEVARTLRLFQDVAMDAITRAGGHPERFKGDGVLALFGYPLATEDAAEMAVRAARAVVAAVQGLTTPSGAPLAARAAVDSGLAFIDGDRGGEGLVAGEVLNLATRLQQVAPHNSVAVSGAVAQLLNGLFELHPLGRFTFKGFEHEVEALEVIGEQTAPTRFEARQGAAIPVLGRNAEVELLLNRWEAARTGEGQVVLLGAEAGMGKSRLARTLLDGMAGQPHYAVYYQGSAFHANSALHPCITHLQRAARFLPTDGGAARLDKLVALLSRSGDPALSVPLAAALLSVPLDARFAPPGLSADVLKARTMAMLVDEFLALTRDRPTLLLVEDAHWIDPSTIEILSMLMERIHDAPAMVLVTHRPEFTSRWPQQAHATVLHLSRLSRRAGQDLVEHVAGKPLPAEVMGQILSKTDGVPLFIEELTKAVLDLGILRDAGGQYVLRGALPPLAIPTTLQDSLLARVDRLSAVKEVAQMGAVIGREFSFRHLAAMGGFDAAHLQAAIAQLIQAEMILPRGLPEQLTYTFKHALIQDAAYSTIILARRQQLHARCADILQDISPLIGEQQPEVLAHHYGQAGQGLAAARHWLRAGRRSVEQSANAEAIAHLEAGLRALADAEPCAERAQLELLLQTELGMPSIAVHGYAAPKTWQCWERARSLAHSLNEREHLARASYGLWAANASKGQMRDALAMAESVLDVARQLADTGMQVVGQRVRGLTRLLMGDLPAADADLAAMLAAYDPAAHRDLGFRFGQNPRVAAHAVQGLLRCLQGRDAEALACRTASFAEAAELRHANSMAYAYAYGGCIPALVRGDVPEVERVSALLIEVSTRHGMALWHAYGQLGRGWLLAQAAKDASQAAEGAAVMAAALDACAAAGSCLFEPMQVGLLAEAQASCGQRDAAAVHIERALAMATSREELWCRPELLRIKAGLATDDADAQALLDAAAKEAETRGLALFASRIAADRLPLQCIPA